MSEVKRPEPNQPSEIEEPTGELNSILKDWLEFASDVTPGCCAGQEWLENLKDRTRKVLEGK